MQLSRILALALVSITVAACDDDDPTGPQGDIARVRVVNAASGTADVDVTASGLTPLRASPRPTGPTRRFHCCLILWLSTAAS